MPNGFSGSDAAAKYEAVCQSCGHEIDLPQGQSYYRGYCPVCGGQMSVEIDPTTGAKAASLPYVCLCLKCGYEKRSSHNIDVSSFCPRCNDAMVVVGYVLD